MASLAERVQISRANAYARVQGIIADGSIRGFSADVDPDRVGLPVCALVFVTVHPQSWGRFREAVLDMPDIEYCCVTTGEHDAMLLIREREVADVHEFVTSVVAARPEIKSVVSVVVLDEVISRPFLLPTDIPERADQGGRLGMTRFTRAADGRGEMARRVRH